MQQSELFVSEFQGKERYFNLNKDYALYEEVKKTVAKTTGAQGSIEKKLKKNKKHPSRLYFRLLRQ